MIKLKLLDDTTNQEQTNRDLIKKTLDRKSVGRGDHVHFAAERISFFQASLSVIGIKIIQLHDPNIKYMKINIITQNYVEGKQSKKPEASVSNHPNKGFS